MDLLVALLTIINSLSVVLVLEQGRHRRPLQPELRRRLRLVSAALPAEPLCLWNRLHYVL